MLHGLRACLPLLLATPLWAQGHAQPKKIQAADGIFLFVTPPYSDVGLDGNAVVILSDDGVLVFDANGTPAAASAVLAEIRKMTRQPVRYLVLSHWHWDHWYGAEVYRQAFPGIQIIAHETTRRLMMGPRSRSTSPASTSSCRNTSGMSKRPSPVPERRRSSRPSWRGWRRTCGTIAR